MMATTRTVWAPSIHLAVVPGRIARYLTVGAVGTAIDFALFEALRISLGLPVVAANTLSYSAGILNNYVLHRHWTYGQRTGRVFGLQFAKFAAISLGALITNNLIVLGLAPIFGGRLGSSSTGEIFAKVCATTVGLGWTFLVNTRWTFRDRSSEVATERGVSRSVDASEIGGALTPRLSRAGSARPGADLVPRRHQRSRIVWRGGSGRRCPSGADAFALADRGAGTGQEVPRSAVLVRRDARRPDRAGAEFRTRRRETHP